MNSSTNSLLRVVVAKRGKVRETEFRLRSGEKGLSLFLQRDHPTSNEIIDAVRQAGKQGEITIAEIPADLFRELGLQVIATVGGTPSLEVNAIHVEARLRRWLRLKLWLRRIEISRYFNQNFAPRLAAAARIVE